MVRLFLFLGQGLPLKIFGLGPIFRGQGQVFILGLGFSSEQFRAKFLYFTGSVWCCFDVCFLTFDVSLWFFGFSFLTCILPFGFLAFVSVLFSCLFCYMHVIFSFCCVGRCLVCMFGYRVCLFVVLLLFYFGAVFMCVFLHACQLLIFVC